jgi:hypothetical protein
MANLSSDDGHRHVRKRKRPEARPVTNPTKTPDESDADVSKGTNVAEARQSASPETTLHPGITKAIDSGQNAHKRFASNEPETRLSVESESAADKASLSNLSRTQADRQGRLDEDEDGDGAEGGDSDGDSNDDAPEAFGLSEKSSLPFAPGARDHKTRSKRSKRRRIGQEDLNLQPEESVLATTAEIHLGTSCDRNVEDHASIPTTEAETHHKESKQPTAPRPSSTSSSRMTKSKVAPRPTKQIMKDIHKDGVIYRPTFSVSGGQDLRGQTSSKWLPAKASGQSMRLKQSLLVRKRIQQPGAGGRGRRSRFVTTGAAAV